MNYLTLGALHFYSNTPGPYQQLARGIYKDLRANIVNNIIKEYYRTGYIYEQYNDKTGEGKGSHPFTGWSALVVLIMAEKYKVLRFHSLCSLIVQSGLQSKLNEAFVAV